MKPYIQFIISRLCVVLTCFSTLSIHAESEDFSPASAATPPIRLAAEVWLEPADRTAIESPDSTASLWLWRKGDTNSSLPVWLDIDGTATPSSDYMIRNGTLAPAPEPTTQRRQLRTSFPPGVTRITLSIIPIPDELAERDETIEVELTSPPANQPAYLLGESKRTTLTLLDDDRQIATRPTLFVEATKPEAAEAGPREGTFTISRLGPTTDALAFGYSINGTAENGVDYTRLSGTGTIPAGKTSVTIPVTPIDDSRNEGDETVNLTLKTTNTGYRIDQKATATVTIIDNDRLPVVNVTRAAETISEQGSTSTTLKFTRSTADRAALPIRFELGGKAVNATDYQRISQSVVIPPGQASAEVTIKAIDDRTAEDREDIIVRIASSSTYTIGPSASATIFIEDNDRTPNRPPLIELTAPKDGTTLPAPVSIDVTAEAKDPDGSIALVEFFVGEKPALTAPKPPYTFRWTESKPGQYKIWARATDNLGAKTDAKPVVVTIRAEDTTPASVEIFAVDKEGSEPKVIVFSNSAGSISFSEPAVFELVRSGSLSSQLKVELEITGTASNGKDYTTLPSVIEMPAGIKSRRIEVNPLPDDLKEDLETVIVTLRAPICPAIFPPPAWCYSVGKANTATVTIADGTTDSNNLPVLSVVARDGEGAETIPGTAPNTASFLVQRKGGPNTALTFFLYFGGTAGITTDYQISGAQPLLMNPGGVSLSAPYQATIPQGSESVLITITPVDDQLVEGEETVNLQLTGSLFPISLGSGGLEGQLTLGQGDTISFLQLPVPTYALGSPTEAKVVILDNDRTPDPSASQVWNVDFGAGTDKLGRAAAGNSDKDAWNRLTSILTRSASLTSSVWADGTSSPIDITVDNIGGQWGNQTGDPMMDSYVYPNNGGGDGAGNITLSLSNLPAGTYDIYAYGKADPTGQPAGARGQSDTLFQVVSNGVPITPIIGTRSNTGWKVADGWREGSEYVLFKAIAVGPDGKLTIVASSGVDGKPWPVDTERPAILNGLQLVRKSVTPPPPTLPVLTVTVPDAKAVEPRASASAVDSATIRITRTGDTREPLRVLYKTTGSALNSRDYATLDGEATIAAGSATRDILIRPLADSITEPAESVVLELLPAATYTLGSPARGEATIASEVVAKATLRMLNPATDSTAPEGVPYTLSCEAIDPAGYISRVEFYANDTRVGVSEITFIRAPDPGTPIQHSFTWPSPLKSVYKVYAVARSSSGERIESPAVSLVIGRNVGNTTVSLSSPDSVVFESGTTPLRIQVQRQGPVDAPITVAYSISGTASNGVDYKELPGKLVIPAGAASAPIVIEPIPDKAIEFIETIIVQITPADCGGNPGSNPECYAIGTPSRITSYILEGTPPPIPQGTTASTSTLTGAQIGLMDITLLPSGAKSLRVVGTPNTDVLLERSQDLDHWESVGLFNLGTGVVDWVEETSNGLHPLFYRTRPGNTEE